MKGDPTWRFQWYQNGTLIPGATKEELTLPIAYLGQAGLYHVTVSNHVGWAASNPAQLTVLSVPRGGPGTVDTNFNGLPDSIVRLVVPLSNGQIFIGGYFNNINHVPQPLAAKINPDGSLDPGFHPRLEGTDVYAITPQDDGQILVGGALFSVDGVPRSGIARLNPDGSLDSSFDPEPGFSSGEHWRVRRIVIQSDHRILVAGEFTSFNGASRNGIARLHTDGSLDTSFDPGTGANNLVRALALLPDGNILIGGYFTQYNGADQWRIARLFPDGSLDPSFDQEASLGASAGILSSALLPNGDLLLGGTFGGFAGRSFLVKVVGDSGPVLRVKPLGSDRHQISWLTNHAEGFVLQSRSNLTGGTWHDTSLTPTQANRYHAVMVSPTNPPQFYRLIKP